MYLREDIKIVENSPQTPDSRQDAVNDIVYIQKSKSNLFLKLIALSLRKQKTAIKTFENRGNKILRFFIILPIYKK